MPRSGCRSLMHGLTCLGCGRRCRAAATQPPPAAVQDQVCGHAGRVQARVSGYCMSKFGAGLMLHAM